MSATAVRQGLHDLVSGAPAPALIVDLRSRGVVEVNDATAALTGGYLAPAHDWAVDIEGERVVALVGGAFHEGRLVVDEDSGFAVVWLERPAEDTEGRLLQASRRIARLESRLSMAVGFAQIGFYETELQTGLNHWDARCFQLFELEPEAAEPSVDAMLATLHPDDRVIVAAAWDDARHLGRPGSVRFRLVRGSAETRVIQTEWRVESDANGVPSRAHGVMADITPTYRAAQRELELNNRLGLAASVGGVGSWAWELDENIVYFDERIYDIMGLSRSQQNMSMDEMRELVIEEDREALEAATARVLREHGEVQSEYRIRRGADRDLRHLLTRRTAQRNEFGVPVRIVAVVIDITETKRREAQIAELAARLEFATDAGGIGVWDWDLRTGIVFYSRQYRALLGYSEAEWPDLAGVWERHLHRDDGAQSIKALEDYLAGRADAYSSEHRLLCKDGRWRWFFDRGAIVERDALTGAPLRMVGTLIDLTERKQAEIALREAQARMELATVANGFGIYEYDYATRTFTFDGQTALIYGLASTRTTVAHDDWAQLLSPDDRSRVDAEIARRRRVGRGSQLEFRVLDADGTTRWLFTSFVTRQRDDGGASLIGTVVDVSQRHDAERAARIASERLAVATQAAGIGIWERDVATGELIWDDEMYRLFGVARSDSTSPRKITQAGVLAADAAEIEARIADTARSGRPYVHEYRIRRADGAERWLAARGTLKQNPDGSAERILGVNWDVTESRAAQAAASDAAERLRLATAATGIGIWSRDFARDEIFWDAQLFRLFGREPADERAARALWSESVPEADRIRVRARHQQALRDARPFSYEFTAHTADGAERRIAARGIVQQDADGRGGVRLIGVNWDVTEQRMAEQALLAKEAAEQASRAKSEFLSRMSHELRTPLNAILGFAQLLQLDATSRLDSGQRARVDRIQAAGWHLLELINEVLDLSRIEAGAVKLAAEPIAVAELVSECVDLILPQAQTGGLALALDTLRGAHLEVVADRTRLKQVLLNLLSNAVKYNFAGGSITVGIEQPTADGMAAISVSDTGRGMTRDQLDRLYEPFDRLGIDTTSIEGTGIGLAISRRLVELMGGRIDVSSEPGVGSEFRVRLPLAERVEAPATRTPTTSTMPPAAVRVEHDPHRVGTILYIEDNPLNRLLIEQYLNLRPGLTLVQAEDGLTGVVLARVLQPDLTIVDINLPDIDGFEVLRRLREDPVTRPLRCVALSANAMPQDIGRALQAGFAEYWTKPIAIDDFLAKVDASMAWA